jgi:hypothetical protein
MTNYYIQQDDTIVIFDTDKAKLQTTLDFMPQYQGLEIQETERPIVLCDDCGAFEFADTDEYTNHIIETRKQNFLNEFFLIPNYGYYRKQPKGYSSAIESISVISNMITFGVTTIPAGTLTFYQEPDFTDETQCTEEWLIANQVKSEEMTATEFAQFYTTFVTVWNAQEHV